MLRVGTLQDEYERQVTELVNKLNRTAMQQQGQQQQQQQVVQQQQLGMQPELQGELMACRPAGFEGST